MAKRKNILPQLGANIRKIRLKEDLKQGQLAANASLTREFINKLESGKVNVSVTKLNQIANALGVDITELFE